MPGCRWGARAGSSASTRIPCDDGPMKVGWRCITRPVAIGNSSGDHWSASSAHAHANASASLAWASQRNDWSPPIVGPTDQAAAQAATSVEAIAESDRGPFRENGRHLVASLVRHLDADGAAGRSALEEARTTACELGAHLAGSDTSLTESVALFVAARKPFMSELGALARRRALDSRQVSMLFDQASAALDGCLLAFIDGHQSVAEPIQTRDRA